MEDARMKLGDALKAIKGAQAAIPSNFQDLAGDALPMLRRALMTCESHIQEGILDIPKVDMLDVLDFLVKSSSRKHRKAQVVECLGMLLVKPAWGRIAASAELRNSLEALVEGQSNLLQILKTPVTQEEENVQSEKQAKTLSREDQDLLGKALSEGREAMREVGWEYQTGVNTEHLSDKAIAGFRSFYSGITKLDSSGANNAQKLLERLSNDLPNLLHFLVSLHDGRKSSRGQVAYVVQRLAAFSPDFSKLMDQQQTLPWRSPNADGYSSMNPQSAEKYLTAFVLVRVGICQSAHKGCLKTVESDGLEVHRFHDDDSFANTSVHVDVVAHIMDLVLNHQSAKEVVGVLVENASKHHGIFEDIRNFFRTRSLELPKLITFDKTSVRSTDVGTIFAANDALAISVVRGEVARREKTFP
jgi:hypothetical protein